MNLSQLSTILCLLIFRIKCARILAVFPIPSISHQVVFRPLTQELARRGHEVVVITTDPIFPKGQAPENLTEIDVHDASYKLWRDSFVHTVEFGKEQNLYIELEIVLNTFPKIIEMQAGMKEVQDVIYGSKFDLLLLEVCSRQALIYSHIVKAPVVQISSFGMMIGSDYILGTPSHPILYPSGLHQRLYSLTFWEKLHEFYKHWWIEKSYSDYEGVDNEMFKRLVGNDAPALNELRNNVDLMLLNSHPVWTNNQPWPPNVVSIWGIYRKPSMELPKDIKSYLDSSKNGVIYFSLGTNVFSSLLRPEIIQMFIDTFSKLNHDVLWKWETDVMQGKSENIKLFKWLPQSDVLKHPKIKAFITQGGLQSTDEAIAAGVPLIGIPMLGDQWYNVEKYVYHRIGLRLDLPTLTKEKLRSAIDKVILDPSFKQNIAKLRTIMNDDSKTGLERAVWWTEYVLRHGGAKHLRSPAYYSSYKDNIMRLRSIMRDQPESALERAVWWTEYVLRHGGAKHLRSPAANMSWTEYYEIEFNTEIQQQEFAHTKLILIFISLRVSQAPAIVKQGFRKSSRVSE
ncbi:UDP-glucosyltransferase 2-like [Zerene cesonia]|uniref:UDP-glucosyltransferase 2-like n=1 Tax=Zerene cesonia TaxID=33412 RepID=UPI0018E57444|nr:UDP-glucosyltransferase 2-like [Zerene cesonia]